MELDDIFGYDKLVAAEKANPQAGMNYRAGKDYSLFLTFLFLIIPIACFAPTFSNRRRLMFAPRTRP